MVEPISIIGFAMACLGFMVTVRTGIERLYNDVDSFQNLPETLVPLSGRLYLLSINLRTWQSFWHVHDGTPTKVYQSVAVAALQCADQILFAALHFLLGSTWQWSC